MHKNRKKTILPVTVVLFFLVTFFTGLFPADFGIGANPVLAADSRTYLPLVVTPENPLVVPDQYSTIYGSKLNWGECLRIYSDTEALVTNNTFDRGVVSAEEYGIGRHAAVSL